jgi:hypothetical protein
LKRINQLSLPVINGLHDLTIVIVTFAGSLIIFLLISDVDGKQSIATMSNSYLLSINGFVIDIEPFESIENGILGVVI